jgi:hypothetical protein
VSTTRTSPGGLSHRYGSASPRRPLQCGRATHETCNILPPTFVPHLADATRLLARHEHLGVRCWGAWSWVYACISAATVLSTGCFGLSSARAFRAFVFLSLAHRARSLRSEAVRLQDDPTFYPWLAVLGPTGAKRRGCKMMTCTSFPSLHLHTYLGSLALAGLGALWVSLDLTFPHSLFDGCRQVFRPVVKSTLAFFVGFLGFRGIFESGAVLAFGAALV